MRQLIKVKRGVSRTRDQPEEKITQHSLIDINGSWTLTGETGFTIWPISVKVTKKYAVPYN